MVDVLTDNKNRISSDIRIAINKCGGTLATPGAVAYNFERKGQIRLARDKVDEETLVLLVSDAGAEDFAVDAEGFMITTSLTSYATVKGAIERAKMAWEEAELAMVPKTWVEVSDEIADQNIALIEWLENLDDVDAVYHNMKISIL